MLYPVGREACSSIVTRAARLAETWEENTGKSKWACLFTVDPVLVFGHIGNISYQGQRQTQGLRGKGKGKRKRRERYRAWLDADSLAIRDGPSWCRFRDPKWFGWCLLLMQYCFSGDDVVSGHGSGVWWLKRGPHDTPNPSYGRTSRDGGGCIDYHHSLITRNRWRLMEHKTVSILHRFPARSLRAVVKQEDRHSRSVRAFPEDL